MPDSTTHSSSSPDYDDEERRKRAALVNFLSAGLDPAPSRAILVSVLADARRSVAALQSRGESVTQWLESEARLRGVKENAATLAALEVSNQRETIANSYRKKYPERGPRLDIILPYL